MHIISEDFTDPYLTPKALARRWSVTLHTLEQWRWKGRGPRFFKAGGAIRYPRREIEKFEMKEACTPHVDASDKRFLCIDFEALTAGQE